MEDFFTTFELNDYQIAAVFDGHGGCNASKHCATHLKEVLNEIYTN